MNTMEPKPITLGPMRGELSAEHKKWLGRETLFQKGMVISSGLLLFDG